MTMRPFLLPLCFCLLPLAFLSAQEQRIADSLRPIYEADTLEGNKKLELLNRLSFNEIKDPQLGLVYVGELITLSKAAGNLEILQNAYLHKGYHLLDLGDLEAAIVAFNLCAETAIKGGHELGEISAKLALGDTYAEAGEPIRAEEYYLASIALLRNMPEKDISGNRQLGVALFNLGDLYLAGQEGRKAQKYLEEAGEIFEEIGAETETYSVYGNLGRAYMATGSYDRAEQYLIRAIDSLKKAAYSDHVAAYQESLADLYLIQGAYEKSHEVAMQSLKNARQQGDKSQISKTSRILARLDSITGNYREAYSHLRLHMAYKDSMGTETVDMTRLEREMAELQNVKLENELELKDLSQKRQRVALWATGASALLLIVLVVGSYRRYRFIKRTNKTISEERDRSEKLLLNILPKETAQELKNNGRVLAKRYEAVTVLFTDFKGFTSHAESMDPEKLVESIDYYFSEFDTIVERHGLEKIKTVGDAYMCAGGLPFPSSDHAHRVAEAALDMIDFVESAKADASDALIRFDIRVGINSGPVVAGVVGTKKFAYDIWGDTVNIASRMESTSEVGKINIAEATYQLLKDDFDCEYRGKIDAKNRGKLKMYFMLGKKARSKTA